MLALLLALCAHAAPWPGPPSDAPWTRLPTGVEVQDVVPGDGEVVVPGAGAEVHYVGMLGDGAVFDRSDDRGQTLSFTVGAHEVIPGWEDGLVGMRVGGTRRLAIPADQGYGARAMGPIPPNSALFFEVRLVGVTPPRAAPAAPPVVAEDAWRPLRHRPEVAVADLRGGDGAKARAMWRVCVDYAVWRDGQVVEHTWTRPTCTWYRLGDDDLPADLDAAIVGMRVGGSRAVTGSALLYQVELTSTGK